MNKTLLVTWSLLLLLSTISKGQQSISGPDQLHAHLLMDLEENSNRFGILLEADRTMFATKSERYALRAGIFGRAYTQHDTPNDPFEYRAFSYSLGFTLTNQLSLLKSKKLWVANTIYLGGEYFRSNSSFIHPITNLYQENSFSQIDSSLGTLGKTGYQLTDRFGVQGLVQMDVSYLVDRLLYGPAPFYPIVEWMYGLGVTYRIP